MMHPHVNESMNCLKSSHVTSVRTTVIAATVTANHCMRSTMANIRSSTLSTYRIDSTANTT